MGLWKDIILWKYERASWQWDVLCLLIIAFIFLTPKNWFEGNGRVATETRKVTVKASDVAADKLQMAQHVRRETGRADAEIVSFTERRDASGELYYELEVR